MRCFVAVEVSEDVKHQLAAVISAAKNFGADGSFSSAGQLHCTLAFLGEKSEGEVKKTIAALNEIKFQKFGVTAKGLGFFPSEGFARVFWAGLESNQLLELQKQVAQALAVGENKPFKPHVTLGRIKSRRNLSALIDFASKNTETRFGEFGVTRFVLKKSTLSPQGAVHEDVAEFALV